MSTVTPNPTISKKRRRDDEKETPSTFETPTTAAEKNAAAALLTSPTRTSRQEEQQELRTLNQRLGSYVLQQRQRDADYDNLKRMFDELKEKTDKEVAAVKARYAAQLEVERKRNEDVSHSSQQAEEENIRLKDTAQELNKNIDEERERLAAKSRQLTDTQDELSRLRAQLLKANDDLQRANEELQNNAQTINQLKDGVAKEKKRADGLADESTNYKTKFQLVQEDFGTYKKQAEDDARIAQETIKDLTEKYNAQEQELRKEFGDQLKLLVAEVQEQANEHMKEALDDVKQVYEDKIQALRDQLQALQDEAEKLRNDASEFDTKLRQLKTENAELANVRQQLETRITEVQKTAEVTEKKLSGEIKRQKETINNLQESTISWEQQFDDVLNTKVQLATEIRAYRQLLENEEERMGYFVPNGKGARDFTSSLSIVSMDITGRRIRVKNAAVEDISLEGWKLRSKETKTEFDFPTETLRPRESVTVRTGRNRRALAEDEVLWEGDNWRVEGDTVELVAPDGKIVSEGLVRPRAMEHMSNVMASPKSTP